MLKVIKCEEEVLGQVPKIFDLINEVFGEEEVFSFAVIDDNDNLKFLCLGGCSGLYADGIDFRVFQIDENYNMTHFQTGNFGVNLENGMNFVDLNKKEYRLNFIQLDEPEDGYDGEIIFDQYNPENDSTCRLYYYQMYREDNGFAKIHTYHAVEPINVCIEENIKNNSDYSYGLIPPTVQDYNLCNIERGTIGFCVVAIKSYGLMSVLMHNNIELECMSEMKRYVKSSFIFNDQYQNTYPFCSYYTVESIDELLEKMGFYKEVPQEIITLYNGEDRMMSEIKNALELVKEKKYGQDYVMKLRLVSGSE